MEIFDASINNIKCRSRSWQPHRGQPKLSVLPLINPSASIDATLAPSRYGVNFQTLFPHILHLKEPPGIHPKIKFLIILNIFLGVILGITMDPLLSIIIPTYNRSDMLDRAIGSALDSFADENIEVVVVPNGPHNAWKIVQDKYRQDERVRWFHVDCSHACVARNHGLKKSRGLYVGFLDDDDYLLPSSAAQLKRMKNSEADISVAPLLIFEQHSKNFSLQSPPNTSDFVCSGLLSISINNMTAGCIFLKSAINKKTWREDVILHDDYLWVIGVAADEEKKLLAENFPVAVYVQHDADRLSRVNRTIKNSQILVNSILSFHQQLLSSGRGSSERSAAAAAALLTHAHSVFPLAPIFFSQIIKIARKIDSNASPMQSIFIKYPWLAEKMLVAEWLMVGPRYLTRSYRRFSWWLRNKSIR